MSDLITYEDKIRLKSQNVSDKYKVTAEDMNEIKRVVNTNVETVDEINKPENWVSVGAETPTDGRRVWFEKGKNLFDGQLELGMYDETGAKAPNNANYRNVAPINVQPSTTYTFSINGTSQKYVIYLYKEDGTFIRVDTLTSGTFTTPAEANLLNFRCFNEDFTSDYANLKIQLEQGSIATSNEPYVNPSINVDGEEWYSKPKALYENTTGIVGSSSGTQITLNDNINNYSKLEVTLGVSKSECDTYILPIWESAKTVSVFFATMNYYFRFRVVAVDNTLTFTEISIVGWSAGTSKLFRVVGYK